MFALYARQSVDKKDSISIELQLERCKGCLPVGAEWRTYTDRGFSGTNTNRPGFQQLQQDLWKGGIEAVVVYKLDRISRSLADFARLSEQLRSLEVRLISAVEQIDTAAPTGTLLQQLLVMFAELEQQTIAGRIRDNYHARVEKCLPLGGTTPYGYTTAQGTWMPSEAAGTVRQIYRAYLSGKSQDRIAAHLNQAAVAAPKGTHWSGTTISRILHNTCYVQGSQAVLDVLVQDGETLLHPPEAYADGCGYRTICGKIAAGTHPGIVPAALWCSVRQRLRQLPPHTNRGSGHASWLQGLLHCARCGAACYVRGNGQGAPYVYVVCRGKRMGLCSGLRGVRIGTVEALVERVVLAEWQRILDTVPEKQVDTTDKFVQLDQQLSDCFQTMQQIPTQSVRLLSRMEGLLRQKEHLIAMQQRTAPSLSTNPENLWKAATLSQKQAVARLLLRAVAVENEAVTCYLQ